jgi:hypothetical protein
LLGSRNPDCEGDGLCPLTAFVAPRALIVGHRAIGPFASVLPHAETLCGGGGCEVAGSRWVDRNLGISSQSRYHGGGSFSLFERMEVMVDLRGVPSLTIPVERSV